MERLLATGGTPVATLVKPRVPDAIGPAKLDVYETLRKAEGKWGALAEALVPSDPTLRTKEHRRNTAFLALKIYLEWTKMVRIPQDRIDIIVLGAWLHDMGKNSEIRGILKRPVKPGQKEKIQIRDHVLLGAAKLWDSKGEITQWGADKELERLIDPVALSVYYHHERADGKGDLGVPGEFVPVGSQITSLAETFDAALHGKKVEVGKKGVRYRKGQRPKNFQRAWREIESKKERWHPTYREALFRVLKNMTREEKLLFKADRIYSVLGFTSPA